MGFFEGGVGRLAGSALTKNSPAYVQYYVTARCNLRCEQCNVIYANADQEECTTDQAKRIAENLGAIGTSVVLLTGGEPFVRKDLAEIAQAFMANGVHPRIQTNGLANKKRLEEMAAAGIHDISISLDSVVPEMQDSINGGFDRSWNRAIDTIANVNETMPDSSFAALGCVIAPRNYAHIPSVIEFATEIGWWVSLVPAHVSATSEPRSFSTFDPSLRFDAEDLPKVREVLDKAISMRNAGFNLYDSDEYLEDIFRFVSGKPIQWRRRNGGVCDSPNLYFAVQPNGDMAVCCDYRLPKSYPVYSSDFPEIYRSGRLEVEASPFTKACSGCMYGSFPEISISARYMSAMAKRAQLFLTSSRPKLKKIPSAEMKEIALDIGRKYGFREAK